MKASLILVRKHARQVTPDDWTMEQEEKIIEVEIPNIDNAEEQRKGRWYIIGYCEMPEEKK